MLDVIQESRTGRAVHHAVVAAQGHLHGVARHHSAIAHHRHRLDATDREDARIGRVDDRREFVDAKHAEV